jgi:hypothetical protein
MNEKYINTNDMIEILSELSKISKKFNIIQN